MKKISMKIKVLTIALLALVIAGFVSFDDKNFEISKNLDIYHTLFRELTLYYVDETDPGELVKTSIDEMLNSLDPYTVYIPESKIEDFRFMTTGKYGGIGALIRKNNDQTIIAEPYEGFPAQISGLKAGDIILEIDGKSVTGKNSDDISELLKGEPKTKLTLTIETPFTKQQRKVEIERQNIKINSVAYSGMITEKIGYIRLSSFTENCSQEVKNAYLELKKNHELKGLIFDLRGNPGGLLNEAVSISNLFVDKGQEIVSTKGKVAEWNKTYYATNDPLDPQIPITVLVNSGSASASEIVSGVIQDLDRGVIIGTRTYGKGLVQTTRDLSYNSKLKLTTAKYYIPSGRCIQALDYSHRNPDGSVGKVPDSLISEFKTKSGRIVYDGGGVLPDVAVEPEQLSKIAYSLYVKNLIFDYATVYSQNHSSITSAEEFKVTDEIYDDFTKFLADKNYDYTLESEKMINDLEKTIKEEKYESQVTEELAQLRKKLAHDKNKDLITFKKEISELLTEEIVSRYYYQNGRAKASMVDDPAIEKAIAVLQDQPTYSSLLAPKAN
jgi:carboxyl-terminal processing protease